jgi:hypothetical protein
MIATGTGFPASAQISVFIDTVMHPRSPVVLSRVSDAQGSFVIKPFAWPTSHNLPTADLPGPHNMCADAPYGSGFTEACATFTVVHRATLDVRLNSGPTGTLLTIAGAGFGGTQAISIWLDSDQVMSQDRTCALLAGPHWTDEYGVFQETLILRSSFIDCRGHSVSVTPGTHTLCAQTPSTERECAQFELTAAAPAAAATSLPHSTYVVVVALGIVLLIALGAAATTWALRHHRKLT